jgi:hypothetical protein
LAAARLDVEAGTAKLAAEIAARVLQPSAGPTREAR